MKAAENMATSIAEDLLALAPHIEIAHHIPGRIRMKVMSSGLHLARKTDLTRFKQLLPGICDIRINPMARSVIIDYDPGRLPPSLWQKLQHLRVDPGKALEAAEQLTALLAPDPETNPIEEKPVGFHRPHSLAFVQTSDGKTAHDDIR